MKKSVQEQVYGILIAKMPSQSDAREHAGAMQNCPRSIITGISGETYYAVFVVPSEKSWWLEYPRDFPEIIGALDVTLLPIDDVFLPDIRRSKQKDYDSPPCGADCEKCPLRETHGCTGCQAVQGGQFR